MPFSPPKPCAHPGCKTLVHGTPRCDIHKNVPRRQYDITTRRNDPRLAEAKRIRDSMQWQNVREMIKAANPFCCDPFHVHGEHAAPCEQIHHIVPLVERPDLAFTISNLAPLCIRCHSRAEAAERSGENIRSRFSGVVIFTPFGLISLYQQL